MTEIPADIMEKAEAVQRASLGRGLRQSVELIADAIAEERERHRALLFKAARGEAAAQILAAIVARIPLQDTLEATRDGRALATYIGDAIAAKQALDKAKAEKAGAP